MIYEPGDDSFLLATTVAGCAKGICLDMGTGTAIQAVAAAKQCPVVIAVDANKEAIILAKKKMDIPKIHFFESDLFKGIEEKKIKILKLIQKEELLFDTIVFNPPYLPNDPSVIDIALDGGPQGFELIERFLKEAPSYLAPEGQILMVFSSHTHKEEIHRIAKENKLQWTELASQKLFFEELYVYRFTREKK